MKPNLLHDPAFVMEASDAVREALSSALEDGSLAKSDMLKYAPCYEGDAFDDARDSLSKRRAA